MYLIYIRKEPFLNGSNGISAEEIRQLLFTISKNTANLEKYCDSLESGGALAKTGRKDNQHLMVECAQLLMSAKKLLLEYDGKEAATYRRKLASCSERLEEIMTEIKEKEDRELGDIRQSMARMSLCEENTDERQEGELTT